jgi:acyl-[acyl-carrier-protein] desaturase
MDVIVPAPSSPERDSRSKAEVLDAISPLVRELMEDHLAKRRLWWPSEFLPADEQMDDDAEANRLALRDRARGVDDACRVSLLVGLLTEEGLPHFHRLIAVNLGDAHIWTKWNGLWTAEEDRHGGVLRDYVRDARLFDFRHVEMMQYAYQESGFHPKWDMDPYKVFVYTSLQERATQAAHANTGKRAGVSEPTLAGILGSIAADEARHFSFYRRVFKAILEVDVNRALESALAVVPSLEMPGLTMPHFREMADVIRRVGIYGPREYRKIVDEALEYWNIGLLTGLNEAGRKAQEKLMQVSGRLQKTAEYLEQRIERKSFSFDFLYNRILALE